MASKYFRKGKSVMNSELLNFFYPGSICIPGASSKEKSIGYELLRSIKEYGYKGKVYPVNPKADELLGYKCYKSIAEVPGPADLAIVLVPKKFAEGTVDELLEKGVKSIVLVTAGFKETGGEGADAERVIAEKVKKAGGRLAGPNCMGVISTFEDVMLNATFVAEKPRQGKTAFLSQSGAIGAAVLNSLRTTDIKFGHFISVGNKADISENDLLTFWENDENIRTMTFYLESFSDGENFIKPFIENKINKPVIVLKAGRTESGMKAASSHTGAIGHSDKVVSAVLKQFGIIRVDDLNELFNTSKGLENFPIPSSGRIAVLTNAGGPAILAVDAIDREGLKLAELSANTQNKLKEIVHPEGSVKNPVDLLPGGTAEQFKKVAEILLKDEDVDSVVSVFVEPVMVPAFNVVESINSIKSDKPVFQVVMPLPEFWDKYRKESLYKKPLFRNPEEPASVISNMLFHTNAKRDRKFISSGKKKNIFNRESGFLSQKAVDILLKSYGIPVMHAHLVKHEDIKKIADGFVYPVVIKGAAKDLIHKSEVNAVKINIKSRLELMSAEMEILHGFEEHNIKLEEFIIQPYIKPKHELLIGGFRDPSFGPMIMFGTGGKYVEIFGDTAMRSAYLTEEDITEMIDETNIGKILKGVRGEEPADLNKLAGIISSAAKMMLDNKELVEFDFNPVIVSNDNNLFTVDVRIKWNAE